MVLKDLTLKNFRVFENIRLEFNSDLNIIHGLNGQGKTSLLEAIYYLSLTKSFRVSKDEIALKHDTEFFEIKGNYGENDIIKQNVRIYYSFNEGKHVFLNSDKADLFSEIVGINPVILLSPDDLELTYGMPAVRRKFLDILLSQLFPKYLYNLKNYKRCVSQKNKQLNNAESFNQKELQIWNQQLVDYGSEIIRDRLKFLQFAKENINKSYMDISGKNDRIHLEYISSLNNLNGKINTDEIKIIYKKTLDTVRESEIKRKVSLSGPHKDDMGFFKNDYPFKTHGSQGENKSFLMALKFVESSYIQETSAKKPIFLLDDIFGELDNERIQNLIRFIKKEGQTFITTTEINKFKNSVSEYAKVIHIENHEIN
jgi:DNA replication and repair protein RecF